MHSLDAGALLAFVLTLITGFGLLCQLPATVLLLSKLHLIRPYSVRTARRVAIPAIVTVAALITETTDLFSLAIVALPLYLAFEFGLLLSNFFAFPKPGMSPPSGVGAPPADRGASTPPDVRGPIPSRPRRVAEP
jgi:Sec-independent protein secretion pathway component TatC